MDQATARVQQAWRHTRGETKKRGFFSNLRDDGCGTDCVLQGAGLALQVGDFVKFGLEQMSDNDRMKAEWAQYEKERLDKIRDNEVYSDNGNKPDPDDGWYQAKLT